MERGELEGICGIYWSTLKAQRADWLREGTLRPLVQLALEKHPEYPDVPLVLDFARTSEERGALWSSSSRRWRLPVPFSVRPASRRIGSPFFAAPSRRP